ncbi:MAG: hypothetical protein QM765_02740 [Myxococcales bacterium]
MAPIREGKWDCPQCGFKGNRGSEIKCKQCNKVRGNDVKFYVEDDADEVFDQEKLDKAQAGADWVCQYCDAINPAGNKACKQCHADRTEKKREVKEILDQPAAPPPPKPKSKKALWIAGLVALMCGGGTCVVCMPSEKAATLEAMSWERTIEVEKYGTVVKEDWRDEVPSGGRVVSTERRVHHTDKVQTGTKTTQVSEKVKTGTKTVKVGKKDMGNGYFEDITKEEPVYENRMVNKEVPVYREDPVYKDWAKYEIEEWHKDRVVRASAADGAPHWPEARLAGDKEREGKKNETYKATFKDEKGKELKWDKVPFDDWKSFKVGQGYKLKVSIAGGIEGLAKGK